MHANGKSHRDSDSSKPQAEPTSIPQGRQSGHGSDAKAILLASLVASVMALAGGILIARSYETAQYGWTTFVVLPVAAGFTASCFVAGARAITIACCISLTLCHLGLLFTGLEGIACILMATPLIVAGAAGGAALGIFVQKLLRSKLNAVVFPMIAGAAVFGAAEAEEQLDPPKRTQQIVSSMVVQAKPRMVWDAVIAMDRVSGEKPFLLKIGLPVPKRCNLEGTGVGARRICHFDSGLIEQQVTRWDPPRRLDISIVRATLPGRHWLRFEDASYVIEPKTAETTRITRSTTICSQLNPRWYWAIFEQMGVQAEHEYVFRAVKRRLTD